MKFPLAVLIFLLICPLCFASPPRSKEEFVVALRKAYEDQDLNQIHALTWEQGVPAMDLKIRDDRLLADFKNFIKIDDIAFRPAPPDATRPIVSGGQRSEFSYPPAGFVIITPGSVGANPPQRIMLPYAVVDGCYYLVTFKISKIN